MITNKILNRIHVTQDLVPLRKAMGRTRSKALGASNSSGDGGSKHKASEYNGLCLFLFFCSTFSLFSLVSLLSCSF